MHNILIIQDIVKHYGKKNVCPNCLMKIDLQKAYDTVHRNFLDKMLHSLLFP